jgi:hypothetical protein
LNKLGSTIVFDKLDSENKRHTCFSNFENTKNSQPSLATPSPPDTHHSITAEGKKSSTARRQQNENMRHVVTMPENERENELKEGKLKKRKILFYIFIFSRRLKKLFCYFFQTPFLLLLPSLLCSGSFVYVADERKD